MSGVSEHFSQQFPSNYEPELRLSIQNLTRFPGYDEKDRLAPLGRLHVVAANVEPGQCNAPNGNCTVRIPRKTNYKRQRADE